MFFTYGQILGYLSGSSPHIKSGAVSALSVLVYQDPVICLSMPDLVHSLLCLLKAKAAEVIKVSFSLVLVLHKLCTFKQHLVDCYIMTGCFRFCESNGLFLASKRHSEFSC